MFRIFDILGSIDDKIENNEKIIDKLELYKNLDYLNSVNSLNFDLVPILDKISFEGGSQPPKSEHIYTYKDGYVRFIQNRDYTNENHLTYIKKSKRNKLCNEYDIMMDKYGEAGKVRYGLSGAYNVALAKITPKDENTQEWIREFFKTKEIESFIYASSLASTRPSVNENIFMDIKMPLPRKDWLENFEERHKLIVSKILLIKKEITKLIELKEKYLNLFFE